MADQENKREPLPKGPQAVPEKTKFDPESKKGEVVISISMDDLELAEESQIRGFSQVKTGGGSKTTFGKKRDDRSAVHGTQKGSHKVFQVAALGGGDEVASTIVGTGAESTHVDIPASESQTPESSVGAYPVIKQTYSPLAQAMIQNGYVGSDPNRGVPQREFNMNVMVHPNGENIVIPEPIKPLVLADYAVADIEQTVLATAVNGHTVMGVRPSSKKRALQDGAADINNWPSYEGSFYGRALKITLTGSSVSLSIDGEHSITVEPSERQYALMNDVRTQMRNKSFNLSEALNAVTSDSRVSQYGAEQLPYSPFNTSDVTNRWKIHAIREIVEWLNELAMMVFLAYHTTKLAYSKKFYDLNLEGERYKSSISEWGAESLLGANASSIIGKVMTNECPEDMFDAVWTSIGYAASMVTMYESDAKFTDYYGKPGILAQRKGFLYAFTNPLDGKISRLKDIVMTEELLNSILHSLFFSHEEANATDTLYMTREVTPCFSSSPTEHLRSGEPFVDATSNAVYYTPGTTRAFNAIPWVNASNLTRTRVLYHPFWNGIRKYFEDKRGYWFSKLNKHERGNSFDGSTQGVTANDKKALTSFDIMVPLTFDCGQMNLLSWIIADALPQILEEVRSLNEFVLPQVSGVKGSAASFNGAWLQPKGAESINDGGDKKELHSWVNFYEAMKTPPIHYYFDDSTEHIMMGLYYPGIFDAEGKARLAWKSPEMFTMIGHTKVKNTEGLAKTHSFYHVEMPRFSSPPDTVWTKLSDNESQVKYGDKTYAKGSPYLTATHRLASSDMCQIAVPFQNYLLQSKEVWNMMNISGLALFNRRRTIDPWYDKDDVCMGAPYGIQYNATDFGRLVITGTDLKEKMTLSWWLQRPYNHGHVRFLPMSAVYPVPVNIINSWQPWAKSIYKDGVRTVTLLSTDPWDESILGSSGISVRLWYKSIEGKPTYESSTVKTRNQLILPESNVQLLKGFWCKHYCQPGFGSALGLGYSKKLKPFGRRVDAYVANFGDSEIRSLTRDGLIVNSTSVGQFANFDNGLNVYIDPFEMTDKSSSAVSIAVSDYSSEQFLMENVLNDDWNMWRRAVIQKTLNEKVAAGSEYFISEDPDYHLYQHGLGGWIAKDYSMLLAGRRAAIEQSAGQYTHRISQSEAISHLTPELLKLVRTSEAGVETTMDSGVAPGAEETQNPVPEKP